MKKYLLFLSSLILAGSLATAETVHQRLDGAAALKGDGGKAIDAGIMEAKTFGTEQAARVTASMNQWGYVTYWMGLTTPPGPAVVRVTAYNTGEATATYGIYIAGGSKDPIGRLSIPADAPKNALVNIDLPVNLTKEWSGITVKKFTADPLPGLWIQSVSVILPD